jgi:hypothetical protein
MTEKQLEEKKEELRRAWRILEGDEEEVSEEEVSDEEVAELRKSMEELGGDL